MSEVKRFWRGCKIEERFTIDEKLLLIKMLIESIEQSRGKR